MCRSCFLNFFIIKFHSKPFFRKIFFMLLFLIVCWWSCTLLEFVIYFWSHLTYLGSILALVLCIRHNKDVIWYILVLTTLAFFEESYKLCMLSKYAFYHLLFGIPWTCMLLWALFMLGMILRCLDVCLIHYEWVVCFNI